MRIERIGLLVNMSPKFSWSDTFGNLTLRLEAELDFCFKNGNAKIEMQLDFLGYCPEQVRVDFHFIFLLYNENQIWHDKPEVVTDSISPTDQEMETMQRLKTMMFCVVIDNVENSSGYT